MRAGDVGRGEGYVRALDGVRGVAVLLVLLFHLRVSGFASGFLGVDIFFVLSGFLITTLLLAEAEKTGRVSLPAFWARRARRLLPALVVVLLVVAAAAWLTATFSERRTLRGDLLASAGYVANWRFVSTSSYFNSTGIESPLQHTWSLAIEEQFYLLWPLIVGGLLVAWKRSRFSVGVIALLGSIASAILLAVLWSPAAVERAYMGTDARIFEPLLGSFGAVLVATPGARRFLERAGTGLAVVGAAGLIVCVAAIRPDGRGYYFGGAFLLSMMTLLVVAPLWLRRGGLLRRALQWAPLAWIGMISYGVYLWHWPVILWLGAREASRSDLAVRRVAAAVVTIGAAAISFYAVEKPIRGGRSTARHRVADRARRHRRTLAAVPITLLAVAGVSLAATRVPPPPPGTPVVLLAGDSVPRHIEAALDGGFSTVGWRLVSAAHGACPVTGESPVQADGRLIHDAERCPEIVAHDQDTLIRESQPDLVLWWDRFSISDFLTGDGDHIRSGSRRFWELRSAALGKAVQRLGSRGATVVFVGTEPPGEAVLNRCGGCQGWLRFQIDHYGDITSRWNDMMRTYALEHPERAAFVSITDTICRTDQSPCDDSIQGVPARPDGTHYKELGEQRAVTALVRELAPLVEEAMPGGIVSPTQAPPPPSAAAAQPQPPDEISPTRPPGRRGRPVIMVAGDSVPRHLEDALEGAARRRGWRLVSAAFGNCPVTGETPVQADGRSIRDAVPCPEIVAHDQDILIRESHPDLVLWWDRFSVSDFLTGDGEHVRSGSRRFWELRSAALGKAVQRLGSRGATVVFVGTEPPGEAVLNRCKSCRGWLRFQIDHYGDITSRWNDMMRTYALEHPERAAFVSITDTICRTDQSPCDDSIQGVPARPDGTHYKEFGEQRAVTALLRELAPIVEDGVLSLG